MNFVLDVDLRSKFKDVLDQGLRGICLALSMTSCHEVVTGGNFSMEYLHWASGSAPGGRGRPSAAIASLETIGQPPDLQWPFDKNSDDSSTSYGPGVEVVGPYARARSSVISGINGVKEALDEGLPVVLCLMTSPDFYAQDASVIASWEPPIAGHAVVAVGYGSARTEGIDESSIPGEQRFICIRNSWHDKWGAEGYALITELALSNSLRLAFTIAP
jgi:hypothetical protein